MSPAKVMLSQKERELVTDAGWILTKNQVIGKVYTLFGNLSENYRQQWAAHPALAGADPGFYSPKISKGEQYRGLPWVILDHPRYFTGTDSFAIRSFFWWGHFCSITLQLAGSYQHRYGPAIKQYFQENPAAQTGWCIGVGADPWEHHFEADNYGLLADSLEKDWNALPFLKLAKKIPLHEWDGITDFFEGNFHAILQMLDPQPA